MQDPDLPSAPTAARLWKAAAQLFRRRGYAAASTRELAEMVGMQKGSLYHYMASKADLLFGVSQQALAEIQEVVAAAIAAAPTSQAALEALITTHTRISLANPDAFVTAIYEMRHLSPESHAIILKMQYEYRQMITEVIARAQADGVIDPALAPRHLALLLLNLLNWTVFWYHSDGDLAPDALAALVMRLFLRGVE